MDIGKWWIYLGGTLVVNELQEERERKRAMRHRVRNRRGSQ